MKRLLLVPILTIAFVGCTPGWEYKIIETENQSHSESSSREILTRIECEVSETSLYVNIEIINKGADSLKIIPNLLQATDLKNEELLREDVVCLMASMSDTQDIVILDPTQSLKLMGVFEVDPLGFWGFSANRDLKIINIHLDGLTRGEKPIPMHFQLEWDL